MKHPGKTPPFRGPRGEPVPGSIAEVQYVRIGGIDQWTLIRGERTTNPPLVLLRLWNMGRLVLGGPESSIVDVPHLLRGFRFSQKTLWPEASKLNLLKLAPALQMPVFFLLGRRDHWVPPETSVAYFEVLVEPLKKLVWFEESGHEPFVDEPPKFNAAMVDMVRAAAVVPQ